MKLASRIYTFLVFAFLYAPIVILILFSFNSTSSTSVFSGFSLEWYRAALQDRDTLKALSNTLLLAVCSSVIATLLGTAAAVGIERFKKGPVRSGVMAVTNIPMMNPEIVTGISMMLLFVFAGKFIIIPVLHTFADSAIKVFEDIVVMVGQRFGEDSSFFDFISLVFGKESFLYDELIKLSKLNSIFGFGTLLVAHVTFSLPYVILNVLPKLRQTDRNLSEAAQDLGCKPAAAFFKVVLPSIMPGILTGMIMAFTLSLDDFIISHFTSGAGFQTLPIAIYAMTKRRVNPSMYAFSTFIFVSILILLILYNVAQFKSEDKNKKKK